MTKCPKIQRNVIRRFRDGSDSRVSAVSETFSLFWYPRINRTTSDVIPTMTNTITIAQVPIWSSDWLSDRYSSELFTLMKTNRPDKMWSNNKKVTFCPEPFNSGFGDAGQIGRDKIRRNLKTHEIITAIFEQYGENKSKTRINVLQLVLFNLSNWTEWKN